MFFGEYEINFLGKGRVALPKKIRGLLSGNKVVLTRGFEKCIFGYEKVTWEETSTKQLETPITEEKSRVIRRYLFSGAMIIKFDSQGRVVIPLFLIEHANLKKDIIVIGAGDHFEVWAADLWKTELNKIEKEKL